MADHAEVRRDVERQLRNELDGAEARARTWENRAKRAEARLVSVPALVEALRAIQAVAVMSQSHHAEQLRLDWLREIEGRVRAVLTVYEQSQGNTE